MVTSELVWTMCWKFVLNLARHSHFLCVIAVHVDRQLCWRIIFSCMPVLLISQPTCLYKPDPSVITEHCTDKGLHLLRNYHIRFHIPLYLNQKGIVLINLRTKLPRVVIFWVNWSVLWSNPDWPVEPTFDVANFYEVLAPLHLTQQVLLLNENDDVLRDSDNSTVVDQIWMHAPNHELGLSLVWDRD